MNIVICETKTDLGNRAATKGALLANQAIVKHGYADIILATGASQFEMLSTLITKEINWNVVTAFHLDEYIGLSATHPASFRKYLKERFVDKVSPKKFHYVDGENDPLLECERLNNLIKMHQIDIAFIGIGENGHLAFNDPPADFDIDDAYLPVDLDEACRRQQLGEGWFETIDAVPKQAISMSVKQIMKSQHIICCVPDSRKAQAVKAAVEGPVTPDVPASILQEHPSVLLYLDYESSALLKNSAE